MIKIHEDINFLPKFKNAVVTIGTFDGVHSGHRKIIKRLTELADEIGGESVLISFYPHPRKIINGGKDEVSILSTNEEKAEILNQLGVDNLVIVPFTEKFSSITAEEYISDFLVGLFNPSAIIIGYDHKFGKNRTGDFKQMENAGEKFGFQVQEIDAELIRNVSISSTQIRNALLEGNIATANELLGYPYSISGTVVYGNQLGRTIGFPTANIQPNHNEKLIPANGVYAVKVKIADDENIYNGMMNIGLKPTVGGTKRTIEVNILDFDEMIYNKEITIYFHHRIRDEKKFSGLDELKSQLKKDQETTQDFFEKK